MGPPDARKKGRTTEIVMYVIAGVSAVVFILILVNPSMFGLKDKKKTSTTGSSPSPSPSPSPTHSPSCGIDGKFQWANGVVTCDPSNKTFCPGGDCGMCKFMKGQYDSIKTACEASEDAPTCANTSNKYPKWYGDVCSWT